MDIQQRIRQLEAARGWTHYQLAKQAGLSESTVNNLFRRNNIPSFPTLEALCQAFGVSMAQFFTQSGEAVPLTAEQKLLLGHWSILNHGQRYALLTFLGELHRIHLFK